MTHCSRKRPRSCEEESCELMPISKRINDLHIRSCFPDSNSIADSMPEMPPRPRNPREISSISYNAPVTDLPRHNGMKENNGHCSYRPELSVAENPYYYHANEILYEAHIHRLQRLSKVVL